MSLSLTEQSEILSLIAQHMRIELSTEQDNESETNRIYVTVIIYDPVTGTPIEKITDSCSI